MRLAAVTGLIVLAAAPAAQAGTARLDVTSDPRAGTTVDLVYEAAAGEANRVSLRGEGNASGTTALVVRDLAGAQPGPGCTRPDPADTTLVRCPVPAGATAESFQATLGDGDDRLVLRATAVSLIGNVDAGAGNDTIVSSGTMKGGPGNDSLRGGDIGDLFDEGDPGNGSDTIVGGGGIDHLSYEGRRRSVNVDLQGDRDDGERGERDRVARDVEALTGGDGEDRLTGNRRDNTLSGLRGADFLRGGGGDDGVYAHDIRGPRGLTLDRLWGGPGDDDLVGSNRANRMDGGSGRDRFTAGRGDDTILARDGLLDEVTCGPGRDRARLDVLDFLDDRCERVRRSGPAAAVPLRTTRFSSVLDPELSVQIGCPADGPRICNGRVQVFALGRRLTDKSFRVRAGRTRYFPFRVRGGNRALERIRRTRMVVRTRNAAGAPSGSTIVAPVDFQG